MREKGTGEIRIATSVLKPQPISTKSRLFHSYGINNALVRVYGDVTLDAIEDAISENVTIYKPCLVVGNKLDLLRGRKDFWRIREQDRCATASTFDVLPNWSRINTGR